LFADTWGAPVLGTKGTDGESLVGLPYMNKYVKKRVIKMSDIWTFAGENKEGCSTEFRLTRNSGEEASMILA